MTLTVHLTHHTSSSLDYPPADSHTLSVSVAPEESQPTLAVKMPHEAMEHPELEVADDKRFVSKCHFPLSRQLSIVIFPNNFRNFSFFIQEGYLTDSIAF